MHLVHLGLFKFFELNGRASELPMLFKRRKKNHSNQLTFVLDTDNIMIDGWTNPHLNLYKLVQGNTRGALTPVQHRTSLVRGALSHDHENNASLIFCWDSRVGSGCTLLGVVLLGSITDFELFFLRSIDPSTYLSIYPSRQTKKEKEVQFGFVVTESFMLLQSSHD